MWERAPFPGRGAGLLEQVAELLLEPVQDARLGLAHGGGGDAEVGGDGGARLPLDRGPPERLPGALLEFAADQLQRPVVQAAQVFLAVLGQFLLGDEANLTPPTPPYFVLNLYTNYQLTKHLQLFGQVENAFNATYYTFGTFSPTSSVPIVQAPGATNPRSYSPGAPIAGFVGLRVTF